MVPEDGEEPLDVFFEIREQVRPGKEEYMYGVSSHNVVLKWFSKVNIPTNVFTYSKLLLIKTMT